MFCAITGCWFVFPNQLTGALPWLHALVPTAYAVIDPTAPKFDMS
jgi:hypothetical protein